ncbi:unnamed protein product, partial [Rotaria sp. Silwood2]
MIFWVYFTIFTVSNVHGQSSVTTRISCPNSQALCGESVCYNTTTQYCNEFGTVIQCIAACGNQCYNSNTQQCMNGTVCSLTQRFCFVKYDSWYGNSYNPPYYQCYDPTYEACFNNTVCSYPSRSCNQRCLKYNEVCLNNVTVCNASNGYYYYQADQIKLCNGVCYDSAIQKCTNGTVQCVSNCSGVCYNSSSNQCMNGTICSLTQRFCFVKYDPWYGNQYSSPYYQCYDPTYEGCFNNTLCSYPSRSCNQRCLKYNEVCVNNVTVCNGSNWYYYYQADQIKLCNGMCYDSAIQKCTNGTVQCVSNCSGVCYNSSSNQCMNGTLCSLSQRFCFVKYDYWYGNPYNPPYYQCYDPTYEACFNNTVCSYPSRSCNQRCLRYNEVCLNNVTVCNASNGYWYYQADQIKLCNGTCYDSAIQECVNIYNVSNFSLDSSTPTAMTTTGRTQMTTGASNTSNCCLVEECTNDADCCVSGVE